VLDGEGGFDARDEVGRGREYEVGRRGAAIDSKVQRGDYRLSTMYLHSLEPSMFSAEVCP
jgi:hypothetical protein